MAAARSRPYEQFGQFVLFKKLESDALTDLWRAARIEQNAMGSTIALRRFHAGNREALVAAANNAKNAVPLLTGTSFAKSQTIDVIDNTPFIAHDYAGGRSLYHVVERARGGNGHTPNPIPIDLAVVIAEKVALSLATMSDLRYGGERMMHGALVPQFVWISDDGEIRVAGQMLGPGVVASLRDTKIGAEFGRYFSPEYQSTGTPSASSEIYALGAILYLVVTGHEPPGPVSGSAFMLTIKSARTMNGSAIPNDIRAIIEKSLVIDRAARYQTVAEMKQELSALVHGGKYPATTFNLAFYVSNLLKKELEGETIDRERESKVSASAYLTPAEAPATAAAAAPAAAATPSRKRLPLAIAAGVGLAALIGIGAYMMTAPKQQAQPAAPPVARVTPPQPQPKPPVIPEPIVVQTTTAAPAAAAPQTTTGDDAAARQKAFEDAVKQKYNAEMMKLQTKYTQELQQKQSKNAPVQTASAVTPPPAATTTADDRMMSAAQLDQQHLASRQDAAPLTTSQAPAVTQTEAPAPQPVVPVIHEGDVIDISEVDTAPKALNEIHPSPPPLAMRQHVQGSVIVTVLVSEAGDVLEAKVLTGIGKFGIDEAALRAARSARFSPAVKSGKRVKTWMPLRFDFKL